MFPPSMKWRQTKRKSDYYRCQYNLWNSQATVLLSPYFASYFVLFLALLLFPLLMQWLCFFMIWNKCRLIIYWLFSDWLPSCLREKDFWWDNERNSKKKVCKENSVPVHGPLYKPCGFECRRASLNFLRSFFVANCNDLLHIIVR